MPSTDSPEPCRSSRRRGLAAVEEPAECIEGRLQAPGAWSAPRHSPHRHVMVTEDGGDIEPSRKDAHMAVQSAVLGCRYLRHHLRLDGVHVREAPHEGELRRSDAPHLPPLSGSVPPPRFQVIFTARHRTDLQQRTAQATLTDLSTCGRRAGHPDGGAQLGVAAVKGLGSGRRGRGVSPAPGQGPGWSSSRLPESASLARHGGGRERGHHLGNRPLAEAVQPLGGKPRRGPTANLHRAPGRIGLLCGLPHP